MRQPKILAVVLGFLLIAPSAFAHSKAKFHDDMRKLWEDHVAYTRLYIISVAGGLADAQLTANRLLQNQNDIDNAVADFYGRDGANRLTSLLRDHILIAADLVGAASLVVSEAALAELTARALAKKEDA